MKTLLLRVMMAFALACAGCSSRAAGPANALSFRGTVYQIDTVFNFVDVIMPGGTKRFYADDGTRVHVNRKKAALIDIAMGEQVRGTYRTDAKGTRIVIMIDDVTRG
jgi:hypothetical protein